MVHRLVHLLRSDGSDLRSLGQDPLRPVLLLRRAAHNHQYRSLEGGKDFIERTNRRGRNHTVAQIHRQPGRGVLGLPCFQLGLDARWRNTLTQACDKTPIGWT